MKHGATLYSAASRMLATHTCRYDMATQFVYAVVLFAATPTDADFPGVDWTTFEVAKAAYDAHPHSAWLCASPAEYPASKRWEYQPQIILKK